jgi:ribosome recycling factor
MDDLKKVIADAKHRMQAAVEATEKEFATIRTGRANPAVLDHLRVDYYGTLTPINQVARISVPEAQMILIAPWEKTLCPAIQKVIATADLGLNPMTDGTVVRVPIPALTEERRKDLAKVIGKKTEEGKIAVRNVRRDVIEHLRKMEKDHAITEDDLRDEQTEVQALTDGFIAKLDEHHDAKVGEIMEV